MNKKIVTICTMVSVILVNASVATAIFTADPDSFSDGTDISTLFPGVILSAVGDGWDDPSGAIFAIDPPPPNPPENQFEGFNPSTGALVFGTDDGMWPQLFRGDKVQFRADFAGPASFVSLDFIGTDDDDDDVGVLQAYDSGGGLLAWDVTDPLDISEFETLSLNIGGIAYILAFGSSNETVGIDNLQWIPAPGAILLGSLGVGLVGWLRRRRTL